MGLSLCPSSLTCLSAGILLAKSLVPSPLPYWASQPYEWVWTWQSFYSAHLKGRFPVGGKRGGEPKREEEKQEGEGRREMACILYNHMAGLGRIYLGIWE